VPERDWPYALIPARGDDLNRPGRNRTCREKRLRLTAATKTLRLLYMLSECRACCASNSITRRIFAGRFGAIYFITICCQRRGSNQLCCESSAKILFETARIYHKRERWNLNLLLLMPDHLHALMGIDGRDSLSQLIRDYKRITAKMAGIGWQRNFFDHRLRHDESLARNLPTFVRIRYAPDWFVPNEIGLTSFIPGTGGLTPSW